MRLSASALIRNGPHSAAHAKRNRGGCRWSVHRELLDPVVVLRQGHLRRLLGEYVDYYNSERVHTSIADAPVGRSVESRPSEYAKIIGLPRVGGLHYRHCWREAAQSAGFSSSIMLIRVRG